jgi:hypothetical protein
MKRLLIATLAAGLTAGTCAFAQDTVETFTIAPDHQTVIREFVTKEQMKPVIVHDKLAVGTVLPEDIEINPVPDKLYVQVPEIRNYDYFYSDGHTFVVDPKTRRVVDVIE